MIYYVFKLLRNLSIWFEPLLQAALFIYSVLSSVTLCSLRT
nr:MAG TPA: hypothetical protein [Caudoviricetes sp.]